MRIRHAAFVIAVGLIAGVLLVPGARAGLIYSNGLPDAASGNEMTQWIQAEDFTLASADRITDVRFWAFGVDEPGSYQGSIVWRIYSNSSGAPGAILASGAVVPIRAYDHNLGPWPSYQYDFSIGSVNLGAGTYWLGLHNGPLTTTVGYGLYWESTALNATITGREDLEPFDVGGWYDNEKEHAFQLYRGEGVPEPASYVLLLSGLLGLGALARRKKA